MKSENNGGRLLDGIRILDLSDEKASFCTKLFADLGATVIKIEKPGGDASRLRGPFQNSGTHLKKSPSFYYYNTNKLSITLNLAKLEGKRLFLKLVERADVVVESYDKGYLEKLGIGFETLKKINKDLILASVTGFGQTGLRGHYKTCDLVSAAFGGQMYVTGSPSSHPLKIHGEQSYLTASLFTAIGILLSLRRRSKTGKGAFIDTSLQEAVVASLEHVMLRFFSDKKVTRRQGQRHWDSLFSVFPCKDGYIQMTLFENWETLVEWLERDGMAGDLTEAKYMDPDYRRSKVEHIVATLTRWTKNHTVGDLFKIGQLMRFPWAPVQSPKQILECPQLKYRKFFSDIENPEESNTYKVPGLPFRFDPERSVPCRRPPDVGENNFQIFCNELGLSRDELEMLSDWGVI